MPNPTTRPRKMKRVKAWAVIALTGDLIAVEFTVAAADYERCEMPRPNLLRIIPCTISYQLTN